MPTASPATESREYEARHLLVWRVLRQFENGPRCTSARPTPGADALPVGDHRQRSRRGARRLRQGDLRHTAPGWRHLSARPRPRHPGRHGAADRPVWGGGGLHQTACWGQVRRWFYNATGGLHGVGSSVVNALSSRLDVEVDRNSATWAMSFRRGVPGTFDGPGPTAKFTPGSSLRKIGRVPKGTTGTRVTYWPDRQIFLHDAQLSFRSPGPSQDKFPGAGTGAPHR